MPWSSGKVKLVQLPLLLDALDGVPDDDIGKHLFWLSEKLDRTPFSISCKIASQRHLTNCWKDQFREVSDKIGVVSENGKNRTLSHRLTVLNTLQR